MLNCTVDGYVDALLQVVAYSLLVVIATGIELSSQLLHLSRGGMLPGLRPGWIHSRSVDLSDSQWRDFRSHLLLLTSTMLSFVLLSGLVRQLFILSCRD